MRTLRDLVPSKTRLWIREKGTSLLSIPWNRYSVPVSLMHYLKAGEPINFVDVGASAGHFAESIKGYCGIKGGILIEPLPNRAKELTTKFPDKNISVICAAASAEKSTASMEVLEWDYSSSLLPLNRKLQSAYDVNVDVREIISVQTITLDELCASIDCVDLLKIDVQGAESAVIEGAKETLTRTNLMWMELSFKPLYEGAKTIERMIGVCEDNGFVLTHIEEAFHSASTNELLQVDALFTKRRQ